MKSASSVAICAQAGYHQPIFKAVATRDSALIHEQIRKHLIDFRRAHVLAKIPVNTPIEMA